MNDCCAKKGQELEPVVQQKDQRRILTIVLILNAIMFLVEFVSGVIAGSAALMADATDMLGDALVYGLSLYALNRGLRWKAGAALAKGVFILLLGFGVLVEAGVRIATGIPPLTTLMFAFGSLALAVNLSCLALLWRFRNSDLNMSSTFECSRNDVIANVGVLMAAAGVNLLHSPWPDIIVALAIAALFMRSALRVILEAWPAFRR